MENTVPNDKKSTHIVILQIVLMVAILLVGFFFGRWSGICNIPEESTQIDTFINVRIDTVIDTVFYPKYVKKIDTLYLPGEIVQEPLLVEQKQYEDSLASIWISGVQPKLDSVHFYVPTKEVLIEKQTTRTIEQHSGWCITVGPYIGAGLATRNGVVYISPEIGIGVSVGYSWHIDRKTKKAKEHLKEFEIKKEENDTTRTKQNL